MKNTELIAAYLIAAFTVLTSCSDDERTEASLVPNDSCLYKAVIAHTIRSRVGIHQLKWTPEIDTAKIIRSLNASYYDTAMRHFIQTNRLEVQTDKLARIVFTEFLLDTSYYGVIKRKVGGLWAESKIEGFFVFDSLSEQALSPTYTVLKGPPGILICYVDDTTRLALKREFMRGISPGINDCRGTAHW